MKIDMKKALYCLLGLTFLQDSSADVTRLKLNQDVRNAFGSSKECTYQGIKFVKVVDRSDFIFDSKTYLIKDEYKDAIFCNSANEVIIGGIGWLRRALKNKNMNSLEMKSKIRQIANQQFRNIIKCGLIAEVPQYYTENINDVMFLTEDIGKTLSTATTFNPKIFCTPFVEKRDYSADNVRRRRGRGKVKPKEDFIDKLKSYKVGETYYAVHENWQMPGMSAYIPQYLLSSSTQEYTSEIPVYCGMKIATYGQNLSYFGVDDYKPGCKKPFYNYEHTEKQHIINHMGRTIIAKDEEQNTSSEALKSIEGGHLMMWTEGNPCTVASKDNGKMCCAEFYQENPMECESIDIYFSEIRGNQLNAQNGQNCKHCFNILNELSGGELKTNLEEKDLYDENNGIKKLTDDDAKQIASIMPDCIKKQTTIIKDKGTGTVEDAFNKCFVKDGGKAQYHVIQTQE